VVITTQFNNKHMMAGSQEFVQFAGQPLACFPVATYA
jgi:hypothetical protein